MTTQALCTPHPANHYNNYNIAYIQPLENGMLSTFLVLNMCVNMTILLTIC